MALKVKKEAPTPSKAEAKAKALKAKKAVLKGVQQPQNKEKICTLPPSNGQRHCSSKGSWSILGRAPLGETSLTGMPSRSPWLLSQRKEDRKQYTCVHCGCQGQQAPDRTACEEALWHWHDQGQHPHQAWWRQDLCSTDSQLCCFGCCQQNWDHLNWVQLANSKYKNFKLLKN